MERTRSAVGILTVCLLLLLSNLLSPGSLAAKDKSITGILLYEGPSGPAYLQLTDIEINEKTEVYLCPAGVAVDGGNYKKLPRAPLPTAAMLARGSDGVWVLKTGEQASCAAPQNLKLDKRASYSAKELGDQLALQATIIGKSSNGSASLPELRPGSVLYFASPTDMELAEYLRARNWATQELLRDYTLQYPTGPHIAEIRQLLAGLITSAAESELEAYTKSAASGSPAYTTLHNALLDSGQALKVVPDFVRAQKVAAQIRGILSDTVSSAREQFTAYQDALASHQPGYEHLLKSKRIIGDSRTVDPNFEPARKLSEDVLIESRALEGTLAAAQTALREKQYEDAYNAIGRYRAMAPEIPEVAAVIDAVFTFRRNRGDSYANDGKWELAITEYTKALSYKQDASVQESLKKVTEAFDQQRDRTAADNAIAESTAHRSRKKFVEAYELLTKLSPNQLRLVREELDIVKPSFIQDAVKRTDTITRLHVPIRGRADEDAVREGFRYLSEAADLSDDETIKVKLDLLSDRISDYYLTQARAMLQKPRGSGVGLGWMYLQEAQQFKPDLNPVKDEMTKHLPDYEMRSKLSLGIHFRDQTSRRDSVGFADQLTDAVAASLETAGISSLKIVASSRSRDAMSVTTADQQPNFELLCDILQHRVNKNVNTERMQSHYRAGTREVRSPEWLQVKRDLDAAQDEYIHLNTEAVAGGNNTMKKAAPRLQELQSKIDESRKKLDSIQEFKLQILIEPYNYTRRTIELSGTVEFAFRVGLAGEVVRESTPIKIEIPKTAVVLENVKSEDTDGVVEENTVPDEVQLLAEAESQAKAALIKGVMEKLRELPGRILEDARKRVSESDLDSAAEQYVLYLNCTDKKDSPERTEALQFLSRQYNITNVEGL